MAEPGKTSVGGMIGIGALLLSGVLVVVALVTFMFGYVGGSEFNPQSFSRRRFGFYEIPLVRLQVTPLWRTEADGEIESLVKNEKYVPAPTRSEEWHLIDLRRNASKPARTDPQILARYLDAENDSHGSYWSLWSAEHPELAAILWPEVTRLARLELYILIPPLFDLAENAEDPKQFQSDLARLQSQQLKATADRWQKLVDQTDDERREPEQLLRLAELYQAASELQPDDAELKTLAERTAAAVPPEVKQAAEEQAKAPAAAAKKAEEEKEKSDKEEDESKDAQKDKTDSQTNPADKSKQPGETKKAKT